MPNLHESTAIVTGAAGSLGRPIALGLRDRGCRVIALDRDAAALAAFASEAAIDVVTCDLLDPDGAERCVADVWTRHGPVSILINAVGLIHSSPLVNIAARKDRKHSVESWRRVIDVNLIAV